MNDETIKMAFTVIAGLGVFLLGMRNMSDGLQTIAGPGLRRMIGMVTDNRLMAVGVGTLVTCLVQSSSITSVMVLGFVNSGIMTLNQAMGVILGANVGTTITGWILALKVGKYGLYLFGVSAFFLLFSKREKVRYVAMSVMGVGMVFFGLKLMKDGFMPVRDMPEFNAWFQAFTADTYVGVVKCAAVGCVLTCIVQSSSATLGITIALASTGVLRFDTAVALVLGQNVGTTITAMLASIGTSTNSRRTAYFHVMFNVSGVVFITAVFAWYMQFIHYILTFSDIQDVGEMVPKLVGGKTVDDFPHMAFGIATAHTIFNIVNVIVFLPFLTQITNFLQDFVKERKKREKMFLTNLDFQMYDSTFAAIEQSRVELTKMKNSTRDMLDDLTRFLNDPEKNAALSTKIFKREETLDIIQKEITVFLTDALSGQLSHDLTEEAKQQIRIADELESISDYITQILKLHLRLSDAGTHFKDSQKEELSELHRRVEEFFEHVTESGAGADVAAIAERAMAEGEELNGFVRELRAKHWERLSHKQLHPLVSTTYSDVIHSYRKVKEHLLNVAEVRNGDK